MRFDNRTIQTILQSFIQALKDDFMRNDKKSSGNLINSLKSRIEYDGKFFSVWLDHVDYFNYVNDGRNAGKFPPPNKIKEWIRVKPILPTPVNGKLPTENQLAFLIGRKIATKGIPGTKSLSKVMHNTFLEENITGQVLKMFEEQVNKTIEEFYEME